VGFAGIGRNQAAIPAQNATGGNPDDPTKRVDRHGILDAADRHRRVNQNLIVASIGDCRTITARTRITEDGRTALVASWTRFSQPPNYGQTSKTTQFSSELLSRSIRNRAAPGPFELASPNNKTKTRSLICLI
jgi:hypothetical protein